ncbi:MAG: hypothetical protein KG003_00740 [Bacteroidetes bacterium]|nr:hypothetical protein [Bacteroidota bacterium]
MKKIPYSSLLHYLNLILFIGVSTAFGVMFFVLQKQKVSIIEKRDLATFPEFNEKEMWKGNYTRDLDAYVADNFPFRDDWIEFSYFLRNIRGWNPEGRVKIVSTASPEFIPKETLKEIIPDSAVKDSATAHSLLIYEGKAFQVFGSSHKMAAYYASCLNTFQLALGDSLKFYSVVVPSASEMSLPDKYLKIGKSEKANIDAVYKNLNTSICKADAYSKLIEHKNEYLYFRTDHHWTALGAYYAYSAFSVCAGFEPLLLENLTKKSKKNFLGTLYALSRDPELAKNPDVVEYYMIPGNHKVTVNQSADENTWTKGSLLAESRSSVGTYAVFLGSDYPVMKIESENKNGRRILVLKESFGNAFVPFMAPHFENVYVADIRYFKFALLDFIQKNKINEVLVIDGIFMANNPYFGSKIKSMMYKKVPSLQVKNPKDSTRKK